MAVEWFKRRIPSLGIRKPIERVAEPRASSRRLRNAMRCLVHERRCRPQEATNHIAVSEESALAKLPK